MCSVFGKSAPGPGKASALHWPSALSRRQPWASEHLFVSGCEIVSSPGHPGPAESFISRCDPACVKCDSCDKRQTGVTAPLILCLLSPGLSFFQTE